ncbi:response regulator transcription factor [Xiamenia xianingshaonis]|uniref:Response regulator n=1 Tax=Xiamenia xianingshaonis TaxID=2682776 RepID=A0A9E6SUS9_9ACTN|nr:response regulator transcription factor [Xiamenia xianingshaonis]NGM16540.1 response regulator [Eggerthellaceae bacterium zg-893]NHM13359.1 response regulator [Xiamenia xianingshaonis]NHM15225.1 response regulator [Xiamenia xianingshaonis]QTU84562.1 response regulator transcription factor [Xiamenia xianingshaonis]
MIYYVEDDSNIRDLAIYALNQAEFEVAGFSCADDFEAACARQLPDLILLDIMLPGKDGLEILTDLRRDPSTRHIPVMMLTAKGAEIDKVQGLDSGADDYLAKPFGMMELVSRVRALLRRAESPAVAAGGKCKCGGITLDGDARTVFVGDVALSLTRKEFDLLQMLMSNRDHVLSRTHLLESVWGWDFAGNTRTVDAHVQTLRQKIADASPEAASTIETVRGVGYVMRA